MSILKALSAQLESLTAADRQIALTRDYFDALIAGVPPALPAAA